MTKNDYDFKAMMAGMTAEQKIKCEILVSDYLNGNLHGDSRKWEVKDINKDTVDSFWDGETAVDKWCFQDSLNEFRSNGEDTGLECDWSRHYESKAKGTQLLDDSWVGWTYWYGGGKHGNPQEMQWLSRAYFLDCVEEEKMVVVRTFKKV